MKLEKKAGQQMLYEQSLSLTQMTAFSFQNDNSEKGAMKEILEKINWSFACTGKKVSAKPTT
ncbi:MAG: hypothetical protein ACO20V_01655 [Alphaproteobacteria bacterium]